MAVGRKVNIEQVWTSTRAGSEFDRTGVKVNASLRSDLQQARVYAIGDVAGGLQFTHVAGYHAGVIIRSMLFGLPSKAKSSRSHSVGDLYGTGTGADRADRGRGDQESTARVRCTDGGAVRLFRAMTGRLRAGKTDGFIKVMVFAKGKPIGATIVGENGGRADRCLGAGDCQQDEDERRCGHGRALSDIG